ncbi:MAG: UvrD-helicase domain-containing protein [Bacteroidales bacterium]
MEHGTLTIYSASAGSGKTFKLAGIYLAHLFRSKYNYRKILAVTFTNKATAEMKSRILDQLCSIASGGKSDYLPNLLKETGKSEDTLRKEAKDILFAILHDFSRFSVCTIDAFFQKVIRSFARETGLHSGFNVELDHTLILSSAVDEMIASSSDDHELGEWLNTYVMANLDEEKSWDLKGAIIKLSEELFREKFKILSTDEISHLSDKGYLLGYIDKLKSVRHAYEADLTAMGKEALKLFGDFGLNDDMFYYKSSGIPNFIRNLARGKASDPNSYVRKIEGDAPKWSTGKISSQLQSALDGGFEKTIRGILKYIDENRIRYKSSIAILSNIYALGILSDVLRNVHEVATSENSFLISDAGELLSLITKGDQAPFIYEKIGNRFENFMIDEFQDTSILQWNNFYPLILNSMGEGNDNLVVGDVKQSIYRFRNSDWHILGEMKENLADNKRFLSEPLSRNWRSRSEIIRFNNSLFTVIPQIIDRTFTDAPGAIKFSQLYSEAAQDDPEKGSGGYVRLEFVDDEKNDEAESAESSSEVPRKWKDIVLDRISGIIESLQDKGYNASDIGILVRTAREGAAVLEKMIEYGSKASGSYNYNVVSNDSLILSNSHAIIFIIAVLKVLDDPDDMISRAEMIRFYHFAKGDINSESVPLFHDTLAGCPETGLPEGYEIFLEKAAKMPLFEATENIISFFGIGSYSWNVSYLNTFQDIVLNFAGSRSNDFSSFLEWWETSGKSKSVVLPDGQDAAKVFTIHKSKGLEFPVVIAPFLSWHTDHEPTKQPIIWARPDAEPFNELGIVPLRYTDKLLDTVFAGDYLEENYSTCLDNVNLLYVTMTRAIDALYGFVPNKPGTYNGISKLIKEAMATDGNPAGEKGFALSGKYDAEKKVFELGAIPEKQRKEERRNDIVSTEYIVCRRPGSLRLKLHGENYFSSGGEEVRQKINYGKMMHEVFEKIDSIDDIEAAVQNLVMEGKIGEADSRGLIGKMKSLLSVSPVSDWFRPGIKVMKEAEILMPSGNTRRPDRIIMADGKAIIIDFKFGEEKKHYFRQVEEYRDLMSDMGYTGIDAFIWYVEKNKIIKV